MSKFRIFDLESRAERDSSSEFLFRKEAIPADVGALGVGPENGPWQIPSLNDRLGGLGGNGPFDGVGLDKEVCAWREELLDLAERMLMEWLDAERFFGMESQSAGHDSCQSHGTDDPGGPSRAIHRTPRSVHRTGARAARISTAAAGACAS